MTGKRALEKNIPLTETTLFILLALAPAPKHGYAIMKETQALSEGRVHLSTGTLYGALKRLLERGWIKRVRESEQDQRPRHAYALTEAGHRILEAEIARLESLASLVRHQALRRPA